jgi:hypothetical protein
MLLATVDLEPFNDMVTPFEVEAYDILKYRSSAYDPHRVVHQPCRDSSVVLACCIVMPLLESCDVIGHFVSFGRISLDPSAL